MTEKRWKYERDRSHAVRAFYNSSKANNDNRNSERRSTTTRNMKRVPRRIPIRVNPDIANAVSGRYAVVIQPVALHGPAGEISRRRAEGVAVMTFLV